MISYVFILGNHCSKYNIRTILYTFTIHDDPIKLQLNTYENDGHDNTKSW